MLLRALNAVAEAALEFIGVEPDCLTPDQRIELRERHERLKEEDKSSFQQRKAARAAYAERAKAYRK